MKTPAHVRIPFDELSIVCERCGKRLVFSILSGMTLAKWKETMRTFRSEHRNCKDRTEG